MRVKLCGLPNDDSRIIIVVMNNLFRILYCYEILTILIN